MPPRKKQKTARNTHSDSLGKVGPTGNPGTKPSSSTAAPSWKGTKHRRASMEKFIDGPVDIVVEVRSPESWENGAHSMIDCLMCHPHSFLSRCWNCSTLMISSRWSAPAASSKISSSRKADSAFGRAPLRTRPTCLLNHHG